MRHRDRRVPVPLSGKKNNEQITKLGRAATRQNSELHDIKGLHLQAAADNNMVLHEQEMPNSNLGFMCQRRN